MKQLPLFLQVSLVQLPLLRLLQPGSRSQPAGLLAIRQWRAQSCLDMRQQALASAQLVDEGKDWYIPTAYCSLAHEPHCYYLSRGAYGPVRSSSGGGAKERRLGPRRSGEADLQQ